MKENKWVRLLAYITGLVNQELLLQNEYLVAENRILRAHLPSRLRLSDPQRSTLAEIGKRLGRKALAEVARVAKPDTILEWYRKLIAQKFDGSKHRSYPAAAHRAEIGSIDRPNGQAEFRLGLRSDRRCARQSGLCVFGPDGGQRLEAARHCTGAKTKPEHDVEGIHSIADGGIDRHGFLHGPSAELARLGDILRVVLYSPGESSRQPSRDHTTS